MISANELRIGNYVSRGGYPVCIKAIGHKVSLGNSQSSDFVHDEFGYEQINPIPLTPELLESVGFVRDEYLDYWEASLEGCKCRILGQPEIECFVSYGATIQPKSLHHLQNFYHVHTGKELPIAL